MGIPKPDRRTHTAVYVTGLTCENMAHHEERFGNTVVYRTSDGGNQVTHAGDTGIYIMGGISPSSAARPRTCGLALAMVATFCYFPGISMVASIGREGITNQTAIGIVFMSVAGALTVISTVLCLRSRHLSRKMEERTPAGGEDTTFHLGDDANQALLSNRDECCLKNDPSLLHSKKHGLCECDEIQLANKIAQSFTLSRYFANLNTASGPFDLDHEAMDKATEHSLRCDSCPMPMRQTQQQLSKGILPSDNSSSTDSAIFMESDGQSFEVMIDV